MILGKLNTLFLLPSYSTFVNVNCYKKELWIFNTDYNNGPFDTIINCHMTSHHDSFMMIYVTRHIRPFKREM